MTNVGRPYDTNLSYAVCIKPLTIYPNRQHIGRTRVKKTLIASAIAALLSAPAMAQNVTLDQVSKELADLKAKNERLEAEVEYLKQETKGSRKEAAQEAVDVANLKTNTGKFTWSGDF